MQRREFITLLSGAAVWPLSAHAQQRGRVPRVGVLWHAGSAEEEGPYFIALQQALNALGYIDGRTITLEHRFTNEEPDRFKSMSAALAASKVEVLVEIGTLSALAAQAAVPRKRTVFSVAPTF